MGKTNTILPSKSPNLLVQKDGQILAVMVYHGTIPYFQGWYTQRNMETRTASWNQGFHGLSGGYQRETLQCPKLWIRPLFLVDFSCSSPCWSPFFLVLFSTLLISSGGSTASPHPNRFLSNSLSNSIRSPFSRLCK